MSDTGKEESRNLVYLHCGPHQIAVAHYDILWEQYGVKFSVIILAGYTLSLWTDTQLLTVVFLVTTVPYVTTVHSGCWISVSIKPELWHMKRCEARRWCEVPEQLASAQVWSFLKRKSQHGITATITQVVQLDWSRSAEGSSSLRETHSRSHNAWDIFLRNSLHREYDHGRTDCTDSLSFDGS